MAPTQIDWLRDEPKTPSNPEELRSATYGNESALATLGNLFVESSHENLLMRVQQIMSRLTTFLKTDFAQLMINWPRLSSSEKEIFIKMQTILSEELNLILGLLQAEIRSTTAEQPWLKVMSPWTDLLKPEGLRDRLICSVKEGQEVLSYFGMSAAIAEEEPRFATLDFDETPAIKSYAWIAKVDPLDQEKYSDYWNDRLLVEAKMGRQTSKVNQLVGLRSESLANELDVTAMRETKDQQLSKACKFLSEWIRQHSQGLTGEMATTDFKTWRIQCHIMNLDNLGEVLVFLNAAEHLKIHRPDLFLRMLGFEPAHHYTETAKPSAFFGSTFHLAITRTLQMTLPDNEGIKPIRNRTAQLLEFETNNAALLYIPAEEICHLMRNPTANTSIAEAGIPFIIMLSFMIPAYRIREALERQLSDISVDDFDASCEQIKTASPDKICKIIEAIPPALQGDASVKANLQHRLNQQVSAEEIIADIRSKEKLEALLKIWTALPDKELLTDEFFEFLKKCLTQTISPKKLRALFNAHVYIGTHQWLEWMGEAEEDVYTERHYTEEYQSTVAGPSGEGAVPISVDRVERTLVIESRRKVIRTLLERTETFEGFQSQPALFFRQLAPELLKKKA